jgi:MFS family permease
MPSVTIAPTWFSRHRGLAMGIILSGTGIGGIAWPLALRALIDRVGFRNTLRISGAMSFILIFISGSYMTWPANHLPRIQLENSASASRPTNLLRIPLVDWRVARSRKFLAHALGAALQSAAYYTPVFFFASYARTLGYSQATSANFIALSNAANAVGKVMIGHLADRMGRLNTLVLTTLISAVTALALWLPSSLSTAQSDGRGFFIAFTIFYGIFASAYVSLFPTSLVELFGVQNFASVNGLLYMVRGLATLVGTPVAGVLIRSNQSKTGNPRSYENTSIMVGLLLVAATAAVLWARVEAMIALGDAEQRRRKWLM